MNRRQRLATGVLNFAVSEVG